MVAKGAARPPSQRGSRSEPPPESTFSGPADRARLINLVLNQYGSTPCKKGDIFLALDKLHEQPAQPDQTDLIQGQCIDKESGELSVSIEGAMMQSPSHVSSMLDASGGESPRILPDKALKLPLEVQAKIGLESPTLWKFSK